MLKNNQKENIDLAQETCDHGRRSLARVTHDHSHKSLTWVTHNYGCQSLAQVTCGHGHGFRLDKKKKMNEVEDGKEEISSRKRQEIEE